MSARVVDFKIRDEFITLGQLMKAVDYVSVGGEVKMVLANEVVLINNEEDNRRGRKVRPGDVVVFADGTTVKVS